MSPIQRRRRGAILQEATATILMATMVVAGVAQLLVLASRQSRVARQRDVAVREAANVMEQIMARPWADLTEEKLAAAELPAACRDALPGARLQVARFPEEPSRDALQIRIRIDWQNSAGQRGEPVRLVAWRYRREEAGP